MILSLFTYYLVGVVQDFFLTLNFRYVAKGKIVPAVIFSFLVTMMSMLVFYRIFTELNDHRSFIVVVCYAAGVATGTMLGMHAERKASKK